VVGPRQHVGKGGKKRAKKGIMKTQIIIHHAKNIIFKKIL